MKRNFCAIVLISVLLACLVGCSDAKFEPPGNGKYETMAVSSIGNPSQWYGTVTISEYEGEYPEIEGEYEAVAYVVEDIDTRQPFFEVKSYDLAELFFEPNELGIVDSLILSFYIKLDGKEFYPRVDEVKGRNAESWILLANLDKADSTEFKTYLEDGILTATYDYETDYESFKLTYEFAKIKGEDPLKIYEQ